MHYIFALTTLVAVWRHVCLLKAFAQIYMVVGSGILIGPPCCIRPNSLCRMSRLNNLAQELRFTGVTAGLR
ncbi:uncharacterized protein P174DRAFT_472818 [Aspergillus novofumigatus IBT 16806]|uniref:Uncharacterized protein n=1 Tax=Aspergillus novofumigatus (strain IBT 16806) TaxID=1392255 RepID=A0A2I1BTV8_ASPN1|nr:uncharacterized protein P174DRAFT_472818 [Aspergillus novofumigatus IBT 16806]PKX88837.1 hypothetical protein P174DRAFT_472818 [Aspergillus novofumigatus IBT 16806]